MTGSLMWSLVLAAVAFGLVYYPAFDKLARGLASPYSKADLTKRFSAAMVDGLLIVTSWVLYRSYVSWLYLIAGVLYLLLRDSIAGRSVGKFCFGLLVIDLLSGAAIHGSKVQHVFASERLDGALENGGTADTLAHLASDLPRKATIRRLAHQAQCLPDAIFRDQAKRR